MKEKFGKVWSLIVIFCLVLSGMMLPGEKSMAAGSEKVKAVSLGVQHSAAIKEDGSLWLWGMNGIGQLGDGTDVKKTRPVKVLDGVKAVSLGTYHSAAIKKDRSLWLWGGNWSGQLGNGTEGKKTRPVKVLDGVKAVSLWNDYSAAIKEDGSLWLWGTNSYGQLGDGTKLYKNFPVKVLDGVKAVSLGTYHSAAIKEDGSLWLWGYNGNASLGDGTKVDKTRPVKVLDGVKAVSLGTYHSAAIKEDGSLWLWGANENGQLGDGTKVKKTRPVKILDGVKAVSLGNDHSAAIKEDGSLWLWGENGYGQLGDGTKVDKTRPVKVLDGVKAVSLGNDHSAAIKEDGSLWLWGYNGDGQLGDRTTTNKNIPTQLILEDRVVIGEDTWRFSNNEVAKEKITKEYYEKFFGSEQARKLLEIDDGSQGQCYGMVTAAMASVCQDAPTAESYYKTNLHGIWKNDKSISTGIQADDYIKYAHIYQYREEICNQREENWQNIDGVYQAVKDFEKRDGQPVEIGVWKEYTEEGKKKTPGHSLLGVRIEGENENQAQILVYDCNYPDEKRYIKLFKTNGKFTGWEYDAGFVIGNSSKMGTTVGDCILTYTFPTKDFIKLYQSGVGYHDATWKMLLTIVNPLQKNPLSFIDPNRMFHIVSTNGTDDGNREQYWCDTSSKTYQFQNVPAQVALNLAAPEHAVSVESAVEADFTVTIDNSKSNRAEVILDQPGDFEVTYHDSEKNSNQSETTTVTGSGNGKVICEQKKDGLLVTGATELKISRESGVENDEGERINPRESTVNVSKLDSSKTYQISEQSGKMLVKTSSKNNGIYDQVVNQGSEMEKPVKGQTYTAGKFKYKVTALSGGRGSVTLTSPRTKSLTTAVVPDTVTIKGVTLKVTAIGDKAFRGCSKLKSVTFGKYLTKIGREAFSGDKKLSSIKVRTSSLKTVGSKAFRGIAKKAVFSVPRSKLQAYKKLFSKKAGLTSSMKLKAASGGKVWKVTFKDGKKTVKIQKVANGKSAAAPKLKKKGYLLSWSTSFSKVKKNLTVKAVWTPELPQKGYRKTLGGITYRVTKSAKHGGTVQVSGVSDRGKTSYRLPSTVKLGKYRFTVTGIGKGAFQNCKKAKTISLSAGIRKIEKNAFQGTSKNLTVSVPKAAYSSLAKQLKQAGLSGEAKIQKR